MSSPYLRLFRNELKFRQNLGDFSLLRNFLDRCAEVLITPEQRTVVQLEIGQLMYLMGDWEQCLSCLDTLGAYDHLLAPGDLSQFYLLSARLHHGYGDLNQALVFLELAVGEAETVGGAHLAEALIELGAIFHRVGERERGSEFLDRADVIVEQQGDDELTAALFMQRGLLAFRDDRHVEAEGYYHRALALLRYPDRRSVLKGEILRYLGVLAATDGRPYEALAFQKDALNDFSQLPFPFGSAKAYNSLGQTCLRLSRYQEARFFFEKAEELCRRIGAEAERATILGKLGRVYAETGEYEKAILFQQQDLDSSSRFGNYRALAYALRNLGLSYRAKGDYEKAVAYLKDSRDRFEELEDPTPQVRTALDLVASLIELKSWEQAQAYLNGALQLLEKRLETSPEHVHASYFKGVLARQIGDSSSAEAALWQALELSQSFSIRPRQAAVHFELAELYCGYKDHEGAVEHLLLAYPLAKLYALPTLVYQIVERLHELSPSRLFDLLSTAEEV